MALGQFAKEYLTVRHAEGWGSDRADYYRALPYRDLSGRFDEIWRIRARSYDTFVEKVLLPCEREVRGGLTVLDLGAGNGWLSYRLAQRGHRAIGVDILDDRLDGLGALRHYANGTTASRGAQTDHVSNGRSNGVLGKCRGSVQGVRAEFDRLPLRDRQADLVIFNASLHYSTDYSRTLAESLRALRPRGTLVILDSPMYSDPSSGARMVQEREARFQRTYGFASNALDCEHFLTPMRLATLSADLRVRWRTYAPRLNVRTAMTRRLNGLRARREPARFPVIVGHRT